MVNNSQNAFSLEMQNLRNASRAVSRVCKCTCRIKHLTDACVVCGEAEDKVILLFSTHFNFIHVIKRIVNLSSGFTDRDYTV